MTTKILIPLFVVALSVLPLFLYLNNCRFMQRFYWRMVFLHNARRLYTLLLVLVLLVINATLYVSMNVIISLLMMTVVLALSSYRTMAKTLRLLQYRSCSLDCSAWLLMHRTYTCQPAARRLLLSLSPCP